jgi:hypothetical protein
MSKHKYHLIVLSVFLLLLVCSCHKQLNTLSANTKTSGFPIGSFPFDVGDKWTYQVNYEIYGGTDTVVFTVTGKSVIGNDTLYTTQTSSGGKVWDSTIVIKKDNSLSYIPAVPINSLFDSLWLVFPISDTPVFYGIPSDTPICVGANISMTVLGTNYTNLTEIKELKSYPNYSYNNLVTICPNIGIVNEYINTYYGNETKTEKISLISYELH